MNKHKIGYKQLKVILAISIVAIQHSGCNKWLDIKVDKTQAVPTTIDDFQAMLDGNTPLNTSSTITLREVASDGHYYANNVWLSMAGTKFKNAYTWTNDPVYNNLLDWSAPYSVILQMNIILDQAEKIEGEPSAALLNIKGQALFHRARMFYELSQTFSPPLTGETANQAYGIPLRTSPDINLPTVRSTVIETYKQITSDLNVASEWLKEEPDYVTRGSRLSAYGLLARVHLAMNQFDSSKKYSDKYLEIRNDLLNFNDLSPNENFIGTNREVAFVNYFTNIRQLGTSYLVDHELFNIYHNDDLRKVIFFKESGGLISFKGSYGNTNRDIFAGIATDEIYLIRAECKIRQGDIQGGMKDLNDLVRTRFRTDNGNTTYTDQVAANAEEALEIIFNERKKELILRNVRWTDLRRLNQDPRFATTITRTIGGETYTLEPNSYKYTFPVPNDILQKTNIQQNSGWDK